MLAKVTHQIDAPFVPVVRGGWREGGREGKGEILVSRASKVDQPLKSFSANTDNFASIVRGV